MTETPIVIAAVAILALAVYWIGYAIGHSEGYSDGRRDGWMQYDGIVPEIQDEVERMRNGRDQ